MKLTSVSLLSAGNSPINFGFRDPDSTLPFQIRSISGLDTEEITSRYYATGSSGLPLSTSVLNERVIVFDAVLNPEWSEGQSYSDLRDQVQRFIYASRTPLVTVAFVNGEEIPAYVNGFITKLESDLFSEQPAIKITIRCPDPMLRGLARVPLVFEDDAISATPLLVVTDTLSTAPKGVVLEGLFLSNQTSLTISGGSGSGWSFVLQPAGGFQAFDQLYLSSEDNDKRVYIVRGSTTIHLADAIQSNSIWPLVFPGANNFSFSAGFSCNKIDHFPTFWGV